MDGDDRINILKDQVEIGVPLESAAILAGYDFEEIDALREDPAIMKMVAIAEAEMMSKHLLNVAMQSESNGRLSTWLLEKRFPKHFGGSRASDDDRPSSIVPAQIILVPGGQS